MTTITAKSRYQPIRTWQGNECVFAATTSGEFSLLATANLAAPNRFSNEPLFTPALGMPTEKNWFISTYPQMAESLANPALQSAGANPSDLSAAVSLLNTLLRLLPNDAPPPAIVPTWLGGMQAEWHRNGVDLEISANPGAAVEYYFSDGDKEQEGIAKNDWTNLKNYARKIV